MTTRQVSQIGTGLAATMVVCVFCPILVAAWLAKRIDQIARTN